MYLADTLYDLSYTPSKADPDVWIRPATKPNGLEYYEMALVYVIDILCMSHDPEATVNCNGLLAYRYYNGSLNFVLTLYSPEKDILSRFITPSDF